MTYNESPKTVERNQEYLDKLLAGQQIVFTTDEPHKLGYRLREAIHAAKKHGIDPYNKLDFTFIVGNGKLTANPKEDLVTDIKAPPLVADAAINDFDVVATAGRAKANEIRFPNWNRKGLEAIEKWAERKNFSVKTDPILVLVRK